MDLAAALLADDDPSFRIIGALYAETGRTFDELQRVTGISPITQAWTIDELQSADVLYAENYHATATHRRADDRYRYRLAHGRFTGVRDRLEQLETIADDENVHAYHAWLLEQMERDTAYRYGGIGVPAALVAAEYGDTAVTHLDRLADAGVVDRSMYSASDLRWAAAPTTLEPAAAGQLFRESLAGTLYRPNDSIHADIYAAIR